MTDAVDTSAEACRGGLGLLRAAMTPILHSERLNLAQLIEALLAERDALVTGNHDLNRQSEIAYAEREAALAEAARLRELLEGISRIVVRQDGGVSLANEGGLRAVRDLIDAALAKENTRE